MALTGDQTKTWPGDLLSSICDVVKTECLKRIALFFVLFPMTTQDQARYKVAQASSKREQKLVRSKSYSQTTCISKGGPLLFAKHAKLGSLRRSSGP